MRVSLGSDAPATIDGVRRVVSVMGQNVTPSTIGSMFVRSRSVKTVT